MNAKWVTPAWTGPGSPQGPVKVCPECNGTGAVEVNACTCYGGSYLGIHESGCGLEPCPNGCPYRADNKTLCQAEGTNHDVS